MPRKGAKTVMPEHLPKGLILTDIKKKKWCLGPSIGVGGFGEIYSAAEITEKSRSSLNYQYVIKIEPHGNGPLFCEMHFFMKSSKPEMIQAWCTEKKIPTLGVPRYLGSGSYEHNGKKYRFLVMDKYGQDLWHIFLKNNRVFPVHTVFRVGLQLLNSLEYIHHNGYVHADIKGANILLGSTKQTQNEVFLVDFGLASKFTQKAFKPDPKKAHNGTIEYTSRDAHEGVPTKRGDIEILAYNMVQWMGCVLPWEKNLNDPVVVHNEKKKSMSNISKFLDASFGKRKPPAAITEFLKYVSKMEYNTEPEYIKLRNIFTQGVKAAGGSLTGDLDFKQPNGKHKAEENADGVTPEKKQKLFPAKKTPFVKRTTKNNAKEKQQLENLSDNESDVETPVKVTVKRSGRLSKQEKGDDETPEKKPKFTPAKKTPNKSNIKNNGKENRQAENLADSESDGEISMKKTVKRSEKQKSISRKKIPLNKQTTKNNIKEKNQEKALNDNIPDVETPVKKTAVRRGRSSKQGNEENNGSLSKQENDENNGRLSKQEHEENNGKKNNDIILIVARNRTIGKKKTHNNTNVVVPVKESVKNDQDDITFEKKQEPTIAIQDNLEEKTGDEPLFDSESDVETSVDKTDKKHDGPSQKNKGYNAEMLRIQKQIEEKKSAQLTKYRRKSSSSSASSISKHSSVDIIEATPPEVCGYFGTYSKMKK